MSCSQNKLSSLYIDEDGFLMCGDPIYSTSMVDGLRFIPININTPRNFDYEILFINDLNWLCKGYDKKRCSEKYRMK